jgi:hypothetical protein
MKGIEMRLYRKRRDSTPDDHRSDAEREFVHNGDILTR